MFNLIIKNISFFVDQQMMYDPFFHTSLIILSILTSAHNLFVIALYIKETSLQNITNFLLINLSCCDLLTGSILLPLIVASACISNPPLNFATSVFTDLSIVATVLSLVAVVTERYIHLCHPFQHGTFVSKRRARFLVVFIWLLATLISILPLIWSLETLASQDKKQPTAEFIKAYQIHSIVLLIVFFITPTILLIFALLAMFCTVNRLNRSDFTVSAMNKRRRGRRVSIIFTAMYLSMVICWTPLIILRLLIDLEVDIQGLQRWVFELFLFLKAVPSFTNPFLYVWCKVDFRKCALKLKPCRQIAEIKDHDNTLQTAMMPLNARAAASVVN